jgi:hypothetical protein
MLPSMFVAYAVLRVYAVLLLQVDEAVFMSSFIPRSLYQVDNCEAEVSL